MTHLVYVADPMCSWCYGFGPELKALLDTMPDARLDIVVGGLRAYNKEVMDEQKRQTILGHWKHVQEASGLPFSAVGMTQAGFIYDTEPACRAVVTARTLADDLSAHQSLSIFFAIQHAFYAEGKDITNPVVLAEITTAALNATTGGVEHFDVESVLETWQSPMTMAETGEDFQQTQRWGVRGFPALLVLHNNALHMIASGYTKAAELISACQQVQQH